MYEVMHKKLRNTWMKKWGGHAGEKSEWQYIQVRNQEACGNHDSANGQQKGMT